MNMQARCFPGLFGITACLSFGLLSAAQAQAAFKEIKDVLVSCGFAQDCTLSLNAQESALLYGMGIQRSAQPGAKPELELVFVDEPKVTDRVAFIVDGEQVLDLPLGDFLQPDAAGSWRYTDDEALAQLMDALKAGQQLTVSLHEDGGVKETDLSLSGFIAGLIYMDEQQERAGTVDALQARGDNPPPKPFPVTLIQDKSDIPDSIRSQFYDEATLCGSISDELFRFGGGFSAKIDEGSTLVALPCGAPGAYNQSYSFFRQDSNGIMPLSLPVIEQDGPSTTDLAWNIGWSQSDKTLTAFFKGRGLGDCGTYHEWKAKTDGEGVRFVLLEERSKGECDGNYAGGPQNWPRDWPLN